MIGHEVVQIKMFTINKASLRLALLFGQIKTVISRKMKPDIIVSFVSTERQKSDSVLSKGESLSY